MVNMDDTPALAKFIERLQSEVQLSAAFIILYQIFLSNSSLFEKLISRLFGTPNLLFFYSLLRKLMFFWKLLIKKLIFSPFFK